MASSSVLQAVKHTRRRPPCGLSRPESARDLRFASRVLRTKLLLKKNAHAGRSQIVQSTSRELQKLLARFATFLLRRNHRAPTCGSGNASNATRPDRFTFAALSCHRTTNAATACLRDCCTSRSRARGHRPTLRLQAAAGCAADYVAGWCPPPSPQPIRRASQFVRFHMSEVMLTSPVGLKASMH